MKKRILPVLLILLFCFGLMHCSIAEAETIDEILNNLFPDSGIPTEVPTARPAMRLTPEPAGAVSKTENTSQSAQVYDILIMDEANLLTAEEEQRLAKDMLPLSAYCSVAFWTTNERTSDVGAQALQFCNKYIRDDQNYPALLFMINMGNRKIWMFSRGSMRKHIGDVEVNTIPDKVAVYATNKQYYQCASEAFAACMQFIDGKKVLSPFRIACLVLLAVAAGLIAAYKTAYRFSISSKPDAKKRTDFLNANMSVRIDVTGTHLVSQRVTTYESSGSSCSSCSSGSSCSSCSSGSSCGSSCGSGGGSSF